MHVNLLGPVTAYAEAGDADLFAVLQPMHRVFIASLVLAGGRPVGMDTLTEQLWGAYAPVDPPGRLHSCASKVRRAVLKGAAPGDQLLLTREAGGYCLRLGQDLIDVHRFRDRATEARAHVRRDDAMVVRLTREALREWGPETVRLHGTEPLAGLPGEWAKGYRRTLQREHRNVLIEHLAALLRCGGQEVLIAEFAALTDADDAGREDEQLTGLLMQAYYRAGRQAEAIEIYNRTRESLRRKGVEPGRELRMIEKSIRNQDPELGQQGKTVNEPRDLVLVRKDDSAHAGGEAAADDTQETGQENSGPGGEQAAKSGPSYHQHNSGRTVIANQGTQHITVGDSNE